MQPGTSHRYGTPRWLVKCCALLLILAVSPAAHAAPDRPLHVMALGDSLTAGLGLAPGQSFPARLEKKLRADGLDVTVHNAGVSGDTASDGLARIDWALAGMPKPNLVIVELGANDALRGIDPKVTARALAAILDRFRRDGVPVLLAGMKAPPNMGAGYVREFDAIYPALATRYGVPLYGFFLDGVAGIRTLNQADSIHPTAQGVDIIVARLAPMVHSLLEQPATR